MFPSGKIGSTGKIRPRQGRIYGFKSLLLAGLATSMMWLFIYKNALGGISGKNYYY
jgi:hypothetical protein